jgi:coenzyme F420 hydrogenase subunit beta
MSKSNFLEEVRNGYSVNSGVFSVASDKVKTEINEFGLYVPVFDESQLTDDDLIKLSAISAMSNGDLDESEIGRRLFAKVAGIKHNPIIGYYKKLYAGYVSEGEYRARASSGGIATWLLVELLRRNMIDGVIHVHPRSGDTGPLFNYRISKTREEIMSGAKSRYYPADLSEVLKLAKKSKGRYAITGIPSFITELRLLAEQDPEFKKCIKYTIGLICGHQKSMKYAEALAWQHGIKPGSLTGINFRKKVQGQPSSRYITEFTGLLDGKEVTLAKDQNDLFVSNWGHGFFKSKLSDFTDDVFNELSDISLGDAWLPQYEKDSRGTNVIIVRNNDIQNIIDEGLKSGAIQLDSLDEKTLIKSQSGLVHHNRDEISYRLYKKDSQKLWRPTKRLEASNNLPFLRKRVQDVREKIATESHIHYKRAVELDDWNYFVQKMRPYTLQYSLLYKVILLKNKGPIWIMKKLFVKLRRKFA